MIILMRKFIAGTLSLFVIVCVSFAALNKVQDHKVANCHEQKEKDGKNEQSMDCCHESLPASKSFAASETYTFVGPAIEMITAEELRGFPVPGFALFESPPTIVTSSPVLRL